MLSALFIWRLTPLEGGSSECTQVSDLPYTEGVLSHGELARLSSKPLVLGSNPIALILQTNLNEIFQQIVSLRFEFHSLRDNRQDACGLCYIFKCIMLRPKCSWFFNVK